MKIVILDAKTLGDDIEFSQFEKFGEVAVYQTTSPMQLEERIKDAEVIILNKIKLNASNLENAKKLKLICVTATGYDNIDVNYCWRREIGVCNVKGYSTDSVAQLTASMALSLMTHLSEFDAYVKSGRYTAGGVQNHLKPYFHEMTGKTWGIVGLGNIGSRVARIANILGCKVIVKPHRRKQEGIDCVSFEELCEKSDIISVHVPLSSETKGMIDKKHIDMMKDGVIFINVSRGAVADEEALVSAFESGKIGGLGIDVYSEEPMTSESPYNRILDKKNVIFTPHMAWGAYEARRRCMDEIFKNIETFLMGGRRNRVDVNKNTA
ncbi:MAG: hydroxyacid dehydrogenase [Oscillospiraceae bacterium]|nr:hydroxyacid dehydrogenase [Oscillospiraceae bacterium]